LGHHLEPVVLIGHAGITDAVTAAVEQALYDHELIKIKLNEGADRLNAAERIASATHSEVAQVLGRTILLFRQREEGSKLDLSRPDGRIKK